MPAISFVLNLMAQNNQNKTGDNSQMNNAF